MKLRIAILSTVYLVVSFLQGREDIQPIWEPFSALAGVHVGDEEQTVIQKLGEPTSRSDRILDYTNLGFSVVLTEKSNVYSFACGSGCDPDRILAERFKYKTKEGIGINSSEEDILAAYGEPSRRKETKEGHIQIYYSSLAPKTVLVFILDEKGVVNIHSANLKIE